MADFDAALKGQQSLAMGLAALKQGIAAWATNRAINNAQDEISKLNSTEMDDMQKRQQMNMIAQNMTMNMVKGGADANDVQLATGAVKPPTLTQTDSYIQTAYTDDLNERQKQRDFQAEQNRLNREAQLEIAGIKSNPNRTKLKPLTDKHIDELASLDDDKVLGTNLMNELKTKPWLVGPAAGRVPGRGIVDPGFASFQQATQSWFDSYRQKVTGAGASDAELERLMANRPNVKDSPSQFKAKVERIIAVGQDVRRRKLKTLEKSGRDVRGFADEMGEPEQTSETPKSATPAAPATSRMMQFIKR